MPKPYAASTPTDLVSRDTLLSMSGLDFMRAILAGDIAGAAITRPFNFTLHLVEEGRASFRGTPEFTHTNPMGGIHGGWYGTLLDSCMGCAVMTMVPKGSHYTTLEYKVNITRAIKIGDEVEALGLVQHAGRSTAVAQGEIRGVKDGRLYATGSTTCLIMPGG